MRWLRLGARKVTIRSHTLIGLSSGTNNLCKLAQNANMIQRILLLILTCCLSAGSHVCAQSQDFEVKRRIYGIKYPWQDTVPYGARIRLRSGNWQPITERYGLGTYEFPRPDKLPAAQDLPRRSEQVHNHVKTPKSYGPPLAIPRTNLSDEIIRQLAIAMSNDRLDDRIVIQLTIDGNGNVQECFVTSGFDNGGLLVAKIKKIKFVLPDRPEFRYTEATLGID